MSFPTPLESRVRWVAAAAVLVAAAAHLPVIAAHLQEAPYMGVLFIVLSSACIVLGATLISTDPPIVYRLAVTTCGLAMVGYVLTRVIAFPQLADDVGNWFEPLGIVSVVAETVVVACGLAALRVSGSPRSLATGSPTTAP
ncbi:MAG TPA: hypothetical protein VGN18_16885 [Jatrophihabitans sp.]|jgi:hypothetical protein|uniref:hypothetical protein n=1 Tax=Jatrophihabitans sp. TaxID=1932789 RepID=UPI002E01F477|nr:hypothetical protein [Jatrophihabitans sp.]